MKTPGSQTQLVFGPLTSTQKGVDSTRLNSAWPLEQTVGPAWRTPRVSYFKILIFKDTLLYKQHTRNLLN